VPAKKRVLVVEDDAAVARGLNDLLHAEDFTVSLAADGREALAKILALNPDIVLLDVNLPGLNGFEVCRQARAKGFPDPVIMVSAQKDQADKVLGLEAGANDYVTKPFDGRELLARIRAHLRARDRSAREAGDSAERRSARRPRRLLSIMFTDMKDYALKMNEDEDRALTVLQRHQRIIHRNLKRKSGKVIEIIGDAFFVSFESALRAVECGIAIQREFSRYNRDRSPFDQILVRIGIHLGDVIDVQGKPKGDTVNIAARLQQSARPGTISISESVYEAMKGKRDLAVRSLGSKKVKHIKRPLRVYRVLA